MLKSKVGLEWYAFLKKVCLSLILTSYNASGSVVCNALLVVECAVEEKCAERLFYWFYITKA